MQGRERPRIQLTVRRKGDSNIVTLDTGGPMVYESETRVDETLLRGLVSQLIRLVTPREELGKGGGGRGDLTGGEASVTVRRLQVIGEQIFSQLLPEQARKLLRDAAPSDLFLHMDEQLIQVPWELCHDGTDFLVIKFRMGRYVRVPRQVPLSGTAPVQPGLLKVLLIADPTESLPQAAQEAEQLCKLLDGIAAVKVTLIGGKLVGKAELLTSLQAHDIVHFAGHSHYDPVRPSRSGWHLHEGVLTAEELRNLSRPPLLVFSNSCQAGATAAWGGRYQYDEQAFGIGSAFLVSGVRNYIGTFWVVHDEESRDFGVVFYNGLASGLSLGEALLKARLEIRDQKGGERLTWASYMLYGDPAMTPFPVTAQPVASSPPVRIERRLVAILHADVKGYSRLIGEDEEATVRSLHIYLGVMNNLIQKHHGEVIGTPAGDNLLALFSSIAAAVQSAVEIQTELKRRNADLPSHRKIEFRIGINLGDVIMHGKDVHGDGVNIAARLEGLADPGGICISGIVYEQIKSRLALSYEYMGEQTLKNILDPVPVHRIRLEPTVTPAGGREKRDRANHRRAKLVRALRAATRHRLGLTAGIVLGVLALALFWRAIPQVPRTQRFSPGQRAEDVGQPRLQAVGVMPFKVLGADPQLEWMRDAMRDHFNSQLSTTSGLKVYSKEFLDFVQKEAMTEMDVAKQLHIAKIISGSFLAVGNKLRIEAHITDVETGVLEGSDTVEGELNDFFNLHRQLALKTTERLNIVFAGREKIVASVPPASSLGQFKMFLETEGEAGTTKGPAESTTTPGGVQRKEDPHSDGSPIQQWLGVSPAWADDTQQQGPLPEEEIQRVLELYRQAYEKKDLNLLKDVYDTFTAEQREANARYFQNTQELQVTIRDIDIHVRGNEAAVSYTREDQFADAQTGQKVKLDARFTKIFVRTDDGWRMVVAKR